MAAGSPWAALQSELAARAAQGLTRRHRIVSGRQQPRLSADGVPLLSFCSNDYLGLASHPALAAALQHSSAEVGVGSGASHLITGHHGLHHELEQALAEFVQLPRALLFSTGYMANLGVVTALVVFVWNLFSFVVKNPLVEVLKWIQSKLPGSSAEAKLGPLLGLA